MASIFASSRSLINAGIPIKTALAGIAIGLIKNYNYFTIFTDIIIYEDYLGDIKL